MDIKLDISVGKVIRLKVYGTKSAECVLERNVVRGK
jgi:hypothetical protein